MQKKLRYPIGIQTFEKIVEGNYVYIDKTKFVYELVSEGENYFLARPRRFGKSLFISTLKAFFEGKQALFKGLYLENKVQNWEVSPIIHFSMSDMGLPTEKLERALQELLALIALQNNITLISHELGTKFKELIIKLSSKGKVVVLIDEYDKPLINFVTEPDVLSNNQKLLKSFYGVLKDCDEYLRFLFITGVSRFSKVSIFSDLNHLTDISLDEKYHAICGYTSDELKTHFDNRIQVLANQQKMAVEELYEEIRLQYNGYYFLGEEKLYNPWSILNYLRSGQLINYWFSSGTPYFMTQLAHQLNSDVENVTATYSQLGELNLQTDNFTTLLFQTGYLTIKEEVSPLLYVLSHPNREVAESFHLLLLKEYINETEGNISSQIYQVKAALIAKNATQLQSALNPFFAKIPYQIFIKNKESYFHSVVHLIFMLLKYNVQSEMITHKGRIDTVIRHLNEVWIFEFKLDSSAAIAMQQIIHQEYAAPYQHNNQMIWGFGVNFNSETKQIDDLVIEQLS